MRRMTIKAIPDGFTTVTPFLNIKGAADAIELYKKAFGAEEQFRHRTPSGAIAIAVLKIGNGMIRVSDAVQDAPTSAGIALYVENADAAWKRATGAGLEVVFDLRDMFFGDRFGIVKDAYGNRWSIAQHIKDVSPEEIAKLAPEAMKAFQK